MSIKRKEYRLCSFVLSLAIIISCLPLHFAAADNDDGPLPYAVSYTTYDTTYDAIVKMYIKVMTAHCRNQSRGRHDLYSDLLYYDCPEFIDWDIDKLSGAAKEKRIKELQEEQLQYMKNNYGFAILDINGDGIDELIIGCGHSSVYELFTIDNGKVRELIRAGGRYGCCLLNDGGLFRYAYNGGGEYRYELYHMDGVNAVKFTEGYAYDWSAGYNVFAEDECWFKFNGKDQPTPNDMDQHIDASVVKHWVDVHEANHANVHFIPFAAYEKGLSGDGIAVFSVNGKTTGTSKVRVRSKPDSKSKIVTEKKVGTYVNAIALEGDYYKVTVGKKTGYVHKDYLTLLTDLPTNDEKQ